MPLKFSQLLDLLTPHDVAKDSAIFAVFTSPWAYLSSLDTALVLGVLNLVVLAWFRWRSLKLRAREIELQHASEVVQLRARLSRYEDLQPAEARAVPQPYWKQVLSRLFRPRGASRVG